MGQTLVSRGAHQKQQQHHIKFWRRKKFSIKSFLSCILKHCPFPFPWCATIHVKCIHWQSKMCKLMPSSLFCWPNFIWKPAFIQHQYWFKAVWTKYIFLINCKVLLCIVAVNVFEEEFLNWSSWGRKEQFKGCTSNPSLTRVEKPEITGEFFFGAFSKSLYTYTTLQLQTNCENRNFREALKPENVHS